MDFKKYISYLLAQHHRHSVVDGGRWMVDTRLSCGLGGAFNSYSDWRKAL